ncbi:MAG TPA: DUF4097 family beta strand repeat-containing protein [Blastocatellia bacterium]|nr:DUF4097 family beta strand repeat-containing protein [Blastocatellia bacterium]
MNRRTVTLLAFTILAVCLMAAAQSTDAMGQTFINQRRQRVAPRPLPPEPTLPGQTDPGQEPFKLDRGGKVSVANPSGSITINGWDRDTIEVTATVEDRMGPVRLRIRGDSRSAIISVPPEIRRHSGEVSLNVNLPSYAEIESAETQHGDLSVTNIEGAVYVSATHGDVVAHRIGALRIETRNGDVNIRDVKNSLVVRSLNGDVVAADIGGSVEVAATSGDISVQNVGASLRANSASGDILVTCSKGRVDVNTASGSLTLTGIGGDVEGSTASGSVVFRGPIRPNGRYSLKSLSGEVEMYIQPDPPGFTAVLTTYSGELETEFELKINSPLHGPINRRVTGVYGNGQAQLALDSFSGIVKIAKASPASLKECK